ncbi:MAG: hypothetical protein OEZ59_10260, partial [Deltaproteobacteria bacterium]|nr:hypothetical protein [Deltaproteobacteria bacterium]
MGRSARRDQADIPALGFVGWGPGSRLVWEAIGRGCTQGAGGLKALLLTDAGAPPPEGEPLPESIGHTHSTEALFAAAELIFVEGGAATLAPHLAMARLAISDRHTIALLGPGWSLSALLETLHERKLIRCAVLPGSSLEESLLTFYAVPFVPPADRADFGSLFQALEVVLEVHAEIHCEMLEDLSLFAPAALATVIEAMADSLVSLGVNREVGRQVLAARLQDAAGVI